jgi:hypothetical protein
MLAVNGNSTSGLRLFLILRPLIPCERVFSSTKKLITLERNRLVEEIIEASERLKNWWDRGLIQ